MVIARTLVSLVIVSRLISILVESSLILKHINHVAVVFMAALVLEYGTYDCNSSRHYGYSLVALLSILRLLALSSCFVLTLFFSS